MRQSGFKWRAGAPAAMVAAMGGAIGLMAGAASAMLPPSTVTRPYSSSTSILGSTITTPFNPGLFGGPGFNGVAVGNDGRAFAHVNLFAEPPPPLPPEPIFHNSNHAILFTGVSGADTVPFLFGGAGYDEFAPDVGTVTVPSTNYIFDQGFSTAVNNNGVGAFGLRLGATETNLVTPVTGVYFGKTAMPIKEGDLVTAAGVAAGTVFAAFGPARGQRYPDTSVSAAPLVSSVLLNDNNVFLVACEIVESAVTRRAILKVAVDAGGAVLSQTLVAKEGGPVGGGPATWTRLYTTANTCAINNAGDVVFSGVTSTGTSGIYKTSGAGGQFVAFAGSATPTGGVWAGLAGAPVDLNNGGQFAFRGIVQSDVTWNELGDAGETFGSTAGFFTPTTNITRGGGDLSTIGGALSNDFDVDVYQIKIGDPTLPTQQPFSATTVPNPGAGFAGAAFDTVLTLFAFDFQNNGITRNGVGRCDDAAAGVVQSTLTTASLQPNTHQVGETYFLAVSTPRARAVNRGLGGPPFSEMWQSVPGQIAVSEGIAYWVDTHKGQIGRASTSTGSLLPPLQVGTAPQQVQGFQGDDDPNSKLLDQKIAIYAAGANSKILFQQHGYGGSVGSPFETFRTCNLDGTGVVDLSLTPTASGTSAVAIDSVNSKLYRAKSIAGGAAEIYRCNIDGTNQETVLMIVDTGGFGERYVVESIAIDSAGAGKIYWIQTVYDPTVPFYLPGTFIRRASLAGTGVQTLATGAQATSLAIDVAGRTVYYTSQLMNRVGKFDGIDAAVPANTLLATTVAPRGLAFDAATAKVHWSASAERTIRRSANPSTGIENWLSIGPDIGEIPADGPAYLNNFSSFVRDGTAGMTVLPYQIKLTGATFGVQGAMICKNGTSVVAHVGSALPGTANVVVSAGGPAGPIRISDAGNVAWVGETNVRGVFVNSDNAANQATVIPGGTVGTVDFGAGAMDMSSNGQHIVATSGSGTVTQCIAISFNPEAGAGGCCDASGGCQPLTASACAGAGGNFLGAGTACVPDPCPLPGACCGAGGTCSFALASACVGGSTFVGGAICSPSPCEPASGACCAGATCAVVLPSACSGAFTRFVGAGSVCNAIGNSTSPCCKADYNQSGTVTVQDIFDFLGGYFAADAKADINGASGVTVQDIFDYLGLYFGGCA